MPSNISMSRLSKAFNEGRRSANAEAAQNPYDNPKLQRLWEQGRLQQRAGQIATPIPPLEHGETRAQRATPRRSAGSAPSGPAARPGDAPKRNAAQRPRGR